MEGVYGNYAMPSSLARHHIRESCNAILFSQSSYMWIVSCHIFFHNVFHLSTMFIHSSTLPVHQPFESVMGKSGVKTRTSEQPVLPVMQISCWLPIAPLSRIQRQMTSRIPPPPEVHALTWLGYIAHIMHMVSCIAMPSAQIRHALCECLLFAFHIRYVNCAMPCFSASYHICELCTAM